MPAKTTVRTSAKRNASPYSPHPSFSMEAAIVANFKEKTGKTLDEWVMLVKKSGPADAKDRRVWLKEKHGLTTNYARFVVDRAEHDGAEDHYKPEALVKGIFSGNKAHLQPLYEEILRFGLSVGDDVKVCPCATMIPFYRKHVIAQIRVPNRARIDLGFALGDMKPVGRLIDTGGFAKKDRITHRIEISSPEEFNDEAKKWFRRAYERDAR